MAPVTRPVHTYLSCPASASHGIFDLQCSKWAHLRDPFVLMLVQAGRAAAARAVSEDGDPVDVPQRMAVPTAFPLPRDQTTAQALAVAAIHAAHAAGARAASAHAPTTK